MMCKININRPSRFYFEGEWVGNHLRSEKKNFTKIFVKLIVYQLRRLWGNFFLTWGETQWEVGKELVIIDPFSLK